MEEQRRAVARVGECARQCAALAREFSARFHAELESWTHREPPAVNGVWPCTCACCARVYTGVLYKAALYSA